MRFRLPRHLTTDSLAMAIANGVHFGAGALTQRGGLRPAALDGLYRGR
ncbi:hypothetical protein [Streptomyces canus]|nr:hypothetical protein [Streptomyces canus]WSD83148.1 hypothetical protein OG925_01885 [Streptomyces canus]